MSKLKRVMVVALITMGFASCIVVTPSHRHYAGGHHRYHGHHGHYYR